MIGADQVIHSNSEAVGEVNTRSTLPAAYCSSSETRHMSFTRPSALAKEGQTTWTHVETARQRTMRSFLL